MHAYYLTPILILAMWLGQHCLRWCDVGRRARRWRGANR
jgi:hypothetical protein